MSDDNVTPIGRSKPPALRERETQPDWLQQANQLGDDMGVVEEAADNLEEQLRASLEARGEDPDAPPKRRAYPQIGLPDPPEFSRKPIGQWVPDYSAQQPAYFSEEPEPMRADKPWVRRTILAGLVFIGLAAFAISFGAIYDVAGWTGWQPWQQLLTPLLFDAGIVVFTFLSFIRLERAQAAWSTFLLAEALTVASSVIQVIHTLDTSPMPAGSVELWVACVIAAMPPLILSASSYLTGRTIFRRVGGQPGGSSDG